MKVLVTGAAGFIGSHLMRRLPVHGHHASGVDKRWGSSTADWDTWWPEVQQANPDVIVHLGANCSTAHSLRDPGSDFVDNAIGTFNVAEASRQAGGIPIVFTSTCKVVPGHDLNLAPLGLSKLAAEQYLRMYARLYAVPSVITRPSTVYGPGQQADADAGWFTWFVTAALTDQQIVVAGDGTQSRDVLYIDDMVSLLVDQVEHVGEYLAQSREHPYNVGGGPTNEVSLKELLNVLGYDNHVSGPRPPGDLDCVVSDNRRITAVRGWTPTTPWLTGLSYTRTWLKGTL